MESNPNPPQQSGGYMKWKYGNWLDEPTEIQPGKYTLYSVGSGLGFVTYKIPSPDPDQFFVLEYSNYEDPFDKCYSNGTGMLIYRINTNWNGNAGYDPDKGVYDEVYIFRPGANTPDEVGSIGQAYFGAYGRDKFDATTNPKPFLTDGTFVNDLSITDITITDDNKISFTYNGGTTKFVSVTYRANGASGRMSPKMHEANVSQKLSPNTFTVEGKEFIGWALYPGGNVVYRNNYNLTIDDDIILYAVFDPLGIKENENSLFFIQPNPANNYVEIVLSDEVLFMNATAQIYSIQGLLLKTMQLNSEKTQIDISDLAKGLYIVKVGSEAKKLIVR
jgi:hypothetical protein